MRFCLLPQAPSCILTALQFYSRSFFAKRIDVGYLVDTLHVSFFLMSVLWQILAHFGTFLLLKFA